MISAAERAERLIKAFRGNFRTIGDVEAELDTIPDIALPVGQAITKEIQRAEAAVFRRCADRLKKRREELSEKGNKEGTVLIGLMITEFENCAIRCETGDV